MMTKALCERVAALEERSKSRDIEMSYFKLKVTSMDAKLDILIARDNQQRGAVTLGKAIAGTGIFTVIGGLLLTFWERITH